MNPNHLKTAALAAIALPGLLLATGAQAHAHVTKSDPAADAAGPAPAIRSSPDSGPIM